MRYSYFPGCTLHQQARSFDQTARDSARCLGIGLDELEDWQCCGAVYPLATDAIINLASPFRTLASTHEAGADLVTLCSGCLNVLRRTNKLVATDPEIRQKLEDFVEMKYAGERRVLHLLEVLRDEVGFAQLQEKVVNPLEEVKIAPYYGCLLLRPTEDMAFDHPDNPVIMGDLLQALGAQAISYPYQTECCGSYLSVSSSDSTREAASAVLRSAQRAGAQWLVTSCPTCLYNLELAAESLDEPPRLVYFTQLLAHALGCDAQLGDDDGQLPKKM